MYRIVRRQGDSIIVVAERWGIQSNGRNWAKRAAIGKEGQDWLILEELDAVAITDLESFDRAILGEKAKEPILTKEPSPDLDKPEEETQPKPQKSGLSNWRERRKRNANKDAQEN